MYVNANRRRKPTHAFKISHENGKFVVRYKGNFLGTFDTFRDAYKCF